MSRIETTAATNIYTYTHTVYTYIHIHISLNVCRQCRSLCVLVKNTFFFGFLFTRVTVKLKSVQKERHKESLDFVFMPKRMLKNVEKVLFLSLLTSLLHFADSSETASTLQESPTRYPPRRGKTKDRDSSVKGQELKDQTGTKYINIWPFLMNVLVSGLLHITRHFWGFLALNCPTGEFWLNICRCCGSMVCPVCGTGRWGTWGSGWLYCRKNEFLVGVSLG